MRYRRPAPTSCDAPSSMPWPPTWPESRSVSWCPCRGLDPDVEDALTEIGRAYPHWTVEQVERTSALFAEQLATPAAASKAISDRVPCG